MSHSPVRREGFNGQHLIVLPAPVRNQATAHPLLRGLLVTDAGYFPTAEGHRVERPQGSSTHLLILCLHGAGWVQGPDRLLRIEPGDLAWISADVPHAYGADDEHPWTIVWAHFRGDEVAWWQKELGWPDQHSVRQFQAGIEGATQLALDKVYAKLELGYSIQHLLGASIALRAVLCSAIELKNGVGTSRSADVRTAGVREELTLNPSRSYRLEELAISAGLSVPHFCLLFRRQTGYSPIDFLVRERIRRACRLLDSTAKTVSVIAADVGFDDPYYFSRRFHRIMGMSPRSYRKIVKA